MNTACVADTAPLSDDKVLRLLSSDLDSGSGFGAVLNPVDNCQVHANPVQKDAGGVGNASKFPYGC